MLLKQALDDPARVDVAVEMMQRFDLAGASDMQQKGW